MHTIFRVLIQAAALISELLSEIPTTRVAPNGKAFGGVLRRLLGSWMQAPADPVIASVGKESGQNRVPPDEVLGSRISASSDNARVCDALSAVSESQHFGWRCDADGKVDFYPWSARASQLEWRAKYQADNPKSKEWFDAGFPSVTYRTRNTALGEVMMAFGNHQIGTSSDLANWVLSKVLIPTTIATPFVQAIQSSSPKVFFRVHLEKTP